MTVYQKVDVIAVWYACVTAVVAMLVRCFVTAAIMTNCAICLIGSTDRQRVLVDVTIMHMVQMIIMQVIGVTVMFNSLVTAIVAVFMFMTRMCIAVQCMDSFQRVSVV